MFKRRLPLLLAVLMLLSACTAPAPEQKQYTATFLNLFDTVTTVIGRAENEETFRARAQSVHDELEKYHRLFDIYNDYEGINNLKTINDQAGIDAVQVDAAVIELLNACRVYSEATGGKVNAAMGGVLKLWHDARTDGVSDPANAHLPDEEALRQAAQHADFDSVIIDESASTVYISDSDLRLDVGAIAKGWATQRTAENAPSGMLISVGGNVCATGPKDEKGSPWVIGIQNPDGNDYLHTLNITAGSVVTSGDYQRTYMVDGELYHHIIDPDTLHPARNWRAVSVVCNDSGLADVLSTALFILPMAEGRALLNQYNAYALWVGMDGELYYSPGFKDLIRI